MSARIGTTRSKSPSGQDIWALMVQVMSRGFCSQSTRPVVLKVTRPGLRVQTRARSVERKLRTRSLKLASMPTASVALATELRVPGGIMA